MAGGTTDTRRPNGNGHALYDRDEELARLDSAFVAARTGDLAIVSVTGAAGLGKTRLLLEFEDRLRRLESPPLVAYGRALASSSVGSGFQPLREAVNDLLEEASRSNTDRLGRFLRRMKAVAPEWFGAIPAVGDLARAVAVTLQSDDQVQREPGTSMAAQFAQLLRDLAAEETLVLMLDDLHWADESSIDLIFYLSQQLDRCPVLLILAHRPTDLEQRGRTHALRPTLLRIERYRTIEHIDLGRLSRASLRRLVYDSLAIEASDRLLDWLAARSEGNPLFVHEYLALVSDTAARSERMLTKDYLAELVSSMDDIPNRVGAIIDERLESLTDEELRVIQLASVSGPVFTVEDVAELNDVPEAETRRAIRSLTQRAGLIRAISRGNYTFFHGLVREHALQRLRGADRVDYEYLQSRRGRALESRDLEDVDALAYHFHEAAEDEKALHYATRAGQQSCEVGAVREARMYFRWCVEHADAVGSLEQALEARRVLASIEQELICTDQAVAVLEAAVDLARGDPGGALAAEVSFELARAYRMEERWSQARDALRSARQAAAREGSLDLLEPGFHLLAGELSLCGEPRDVDDADRRFREAATVSADDPLLQASAFGHLGFVSLAREDLDVARSWFEQARDRAYASGRPGRIYEAHLWKTKYALATLDLAGANAEIKELYRLSEQYGVASTVAHHMRDSGRRFALLGDVEQMLDAYTGYIDRMLSVASDAWRIRAQSYLYFQAEEIASLHGLPVAASMAAATSSHLREKFPNVTEIEIVVRQLDVIGEALTAGADLVDSLEAAGFGDAVNTSIARAARWIFNFHIDDLHAFRRRHGFDVR